MSSGQPKPSGSWRIRLVIVLGVLAVVIYGVSYFMRPVALVVAASHTTAMRTVPGTVEVKAEYNLELKSEVGGRVLSSSLNVGSKVFKGDTLVNINPGDVDLEIERISNDIVAAKRKVEIGSTLRADEENQKDKLNNLERQVKAGAVSQADFDKEKRLYQQLVQRREIEEVNLRGSLDTLENALRAKQREKSKMTITATSDATVTAVYAREGDLIGSNSPIASLISTTRTIEARISEDNFAAIKLGQRAQVRFLTFGNDQYSATITKVLPSADPTTQRYSVYLDVVLPENREVMPGLTGEVTITIAERPNAVTVPRRALVGDYVYLVENGRVIQRKVEKGYDSLSVVEILKGVDNGALVIVEQQDRFRSGDRVRTEVLEN